MSLLQLFSALANAGTQTTSLVAGQQSGPASVGYMEATSAPDLVDMGSVTPQSVNGEDIQHVYGKLSANDFFIAFDGVHADDDTIWATCSITGVFVGGQDTQVYTRSARDIWSQPGAAYTMWTYTAGQADHMINGNTYIVSWT